jgi:hypothetical protein
MTEGGGGLTEAQLKVILETTVLKPMLTRFAMLERAMITLSTRMDTIGGVVRKIQDEVLDVSVKFDKNPEFWSAHPNVEPQHLDTPRGNAAAAAAVDSPSPAGPRQPLSLTADLLQSPAEEYEQTLIARSSAEVYRKSKSTRDAADDAPPPAPLPPPPPADSDDDPRRPPRTQRHADPGYPACRDFEGQEPVLRMQRILLRHHR